MTSDEYAAQLNPNPIPVPNATMGSPAEFMALQSQQAKERDALTSQQRVADALMKATQVTPYQWQQRKGRRFSPQGDSGFGQVGSMLQGLASQYAQGQAQDDLREKQRLQMLQLTPMPPSATVASLAKPLTPNDLAEGY